MPTAKLGKYPAFDGRQHMMKLLQAKIFLNLCLLTMKKCQNLFLPQHALIISFFINGKMSFLLLLCARDLYYPDTPTIKNVSQSNQGCNQIGG